MKQFVAVLAAALLVTGIYVMTAGAGQQGVSPSRVAKLEKKVTKLQKAVKKIKKQVNQGQSLTLAVLAYNACGLAVTADGLQGTWINVNNRVPTGPAFTDTTSAVDDFGFCNAFGVTRKQLQATPDASVFRALLNLVKPSSSAQLRAEARQLRALQR